MKKNVKRIQRWLDRLSGACEQEMWDSALIEADCLEAEVRKTRNELLGAAQGVQVREAPFLNRGAFSFAARSVGVAFLIVCSASVPSAIEADRPWTSVQPVTARVAQDRLSWVTPEEEELLLVMRAEMAKDNLTTAAMAAKQLPSPAPRAKKNETKPLAAEPETPTAQPATVKQQPSQGISNEDLMALIRVGEKALKRSSPAIVVIN